MHLSSIAICFMVAFWSIDFSCIIDQSVFCGENMIIVWYDDDMFWAALKEKSFQIKNMQQFHLLTWWASCKSKQAAAAAISSPVKRDRKCKIFVLFFLWKWGQFPLNRAKIGWQLFPLFSENFHPLFNIIDGH